MERSGFARRTILPAATVLLICAVGLIGYGSAWRIGPAWLKNALSLASGGLLWLGLGFGVSVVYPWAFSRGASGAERVLAGLCVPLAWLVWEAVRVSEYFPAGQALYFALNPMNQGLLAVTILQMAVWEMVCRRRCTRRAVTVGPLAAVVLGIVGVWGTLGWDLGVHWFYGYMEVYKALFQ